MSSNKPTFDLTGKVALVTGSSSGIGEAIAVQFAQLGAKVTITGRVEENLRRIEKEISNNGSLNNCLSVVGDLLDQNLAEKLINQTVEKFGQLDILVNNAGKLKVLVNVCKSRFLICNLIRWWKS